MIAATARRILALLALAVPASGWACRDVDREHGRAAGPAAPGTVVFRHYL
jgi:hypothetical protein